MTFIRTIPPASATGEVRTMYQRQQAKFGYVPNYAQAFGCRPELMQLWADLLAGIRRHVEPRRFEIATLAAALGLRNSYCSLAHAKALTELLPERDVQSIARTVVNSQAGTEPASLTPAEREIVRYAAKAARDATAITAADVAALRDQGLTDAEIFDLAATVAARAFFTRLLDALGVEADTAYQVLDADLLSALVVGRPIAREAPARVD